MRAPARSYEKQVESWATYFAHPATSVGLPARYITDPEELRQSTAFFAWTAWASVARRPGRAYSYTNNFPYDPLVGNTASSEAVLWSALSLITLLAGTAFILFAFGRFDFLGWKGRGEHVHPQLLPGRTTESQQATIKYFVIVALLFRAIGAARTDPARREISALFLYCAAAIPVFYLPAMFFDGTTHFSVVDTWRFWIIHLWVEGFFELFVTVLVAIIFHQLGVISRQTAARVVYLDAILYLGSGILGTGHHWYWTGQGTLTMAIAATFSAMEVVPLTLLTLDAWDFVKLTRAECDVCGKRISIPHKWTFYFLIAVGFWNFVGAGIFGFLINLPIVSYYEVGTILTANHGHAAMMGVFGMLAVALMVFAFRQVLADAEWVRVEKYVRVSFWGLNAGLALMVVTNLFPGGVLQLYDVLANGYWHARGPEFLNGRIVRLIEWGRLPADMIFIALGAVPLAIAAVRTYRLMRAAPADPTAPMVRAPTAAGG